MNVEPIKFNFKGNKVRTLSIDGKPYFVGKDVASVLGYSNSSKAVTVHVDVEDKIKRPIPTSQNGHLVSMTNLVNESGLYSLILSSKLPSAKEFKHWVTNEVLPSINHTGEYKREQSQQADSNNVMDLLSDPDNLLKLVTNYKNSQDEVKRLQPKAMFADAIAVSDQLILVRQMAKIISNNIIQIGEKRLFAWLRDNGYLIKKQGSDRNMPTQRSVKLGIFKVQTSSFTHNSGKSEVTYTPKITGKGQRYLINKFLEIQGKQIQLPGKLD